MPKNENKPNNQERQAPNQGKQSDEPSRKASSGKGTSDQPSRQDTSSKESGRSKSEPEKGGERSASTGGNAGTDRSRTEPGLKEETKRQGRGQEKTEGLDVDELDEQNQEL